MCNLRCTKNLHLQGTQEIHPVFEGTVLPLELGQTGSCNGLLNLFCAHDVDLDGDSDGGILRV